MSQSVLPDGVEIRMRRMAFDFAEDVPTHFVDNSPYLTHFFNALSALFPEGEKFFIDSVRHYEPEIQDPTLREQIREFVRQEGHHTHQHRLMNELVERQGFPMGRYDTDLRGMFDMLRQNFTPIEQLAITVAIEHFTALLGDQLLRHPRYLAGMDPRVAPLWRWHAVEETEHKSVAYDVYEAVGGDYGTRVRILMKITVPFLSITHRIQGDLLRRDDLGVTSADRRRGLNYLWGRPGLLRRAIPGYLHFYLPSFHPWKRDNSALIHDWIRTHAPA